MVRLRASTVSGDGVTLAVETISWGQPGMPFPTILMAHATGFCKEVMRGITAEIANQMDTGCVVAFDLRAHGASSSPPRPHLWLLSGLDALAVLDAATVPDGSSIVGVGHSCGGAALIHAELERPGTFDALVLVEPIIFPGAQERNDDSPMAVAARRRRLRFESYEEAFDAYVQKPVFARWSEAALRRYVRYGLYPDSGGVLLACDRLDEAEFYAVAMVDSPWDRLAEITCPVTLVAGEHSDTHGEQFLATLARQFGSVAPTMVVVPEASHFVVMETPAAVAAPVVAALGADC